jgi:hypothetical protein
MKGILRNLLVACGMLIAASPVLACEAAVLTRAETRIPIKVLNDGSFEGLDSRRSEKMEFNRWLGWWVDGGPVIDIGNGRIGQKITASFDCDVNETLLFVDCNAGDGIVVLGEPADFTIGGEYNVISEIQKPRGPIKLTPSTEVSEVEEIARSHDFFYERDVMKRPRSMMKSQRYDPFFGCKLFYPNSEGAKQKL